MIQKLLLLIFVLVSTSSCLSSKIPPEPVVSKRPNIILILADDLGYGELSCFGQKRFNTPNIDRIASEGIKFKQFYTSQAVCAPARCSLLTGLHQGHAQIRENSPHLQKFIDADMVKNIPGAKAKRRGFLTLPNGKVEWTGQLALKKNTFTIGHMLQAQGYKTACVGKWGMGHPYNEGNPNKQGFDHYFGYVCQRNAHSFYPEYLYRNKEKVYYPGNTNRKLVGSSPGAVFSGDAMEKECLDFIKDNKDKPFFLYYANPIPHLNLQVPEENLNVFKNKGPYKGEAPYNGKKGYIAHPTPRAAYAGMVHHMDRSVGRIMDLLAKLQIDDNTLIIFTSDNGATYLGGYDREFFKGNGDLRGRKGELWEGGIRVPTVMRWPAAIKAGQVSETPGVFQDFMPTFAEITKTDISKRKLDGKSLLPVLKGKSVKRDHIYWEFYGYGGWQVVRKGDWKGVINGIHKKNSSGMAHSNMPMSLYNLKDDPGETTDLAAQYPQIVTTLRAIMVKEHSPNPFYPLFPKEAADFLKKKKK